MTITGTGFSGATGASFGSTAATSYTVVSATSITTVSPAEATGLVDVSVTMPTGTDRADLGRPVQLRPERDLVPALAGDPSYRP